MIGLANNSGTCEKISMRNQENSTYIYIIPSAHKNVGEDETILNVGWSVSCLMTLESNLWTPCRDEFAPASPSYHYTSLP